MVESSGFEGRELMNSRGFASNFHRIIEQSENFPGIRGNSPIFDRCHIYSVRFFNFYYMQVQFWDSWLCDCPVCQRLQQNRSRVP